MSTSHLRALYMVDPKAAREKIYRAFEEAQGNGREAAQALDVHYLTVLRIMKSDSELYDRILQLKDRLQAEGISQQGWGEWHRERATTS